MYLHQEPLGLGLVALNDAEINKPGHIASRVNTGVRSTTMRAATIFKGAPIRRETPDWLARD
jgi:hypothetical protein